jgi:PAS domain S-box-containing protein
MRGSLRNSGINAIGDVPWGTHICQFYRTKEDLLDTLIPYFKTGLKNNEFCLWVISEPLEAEEVKEALRSVIPDLDISLEKGQLEIISYTDWFTTKGIFDSRKVSSLRVEKLNHALGTGYDGMRLSGNTSWLEKESWDSFIEFKEQTDTAMGNYQLINLCTYPLDRLNAAEIIDVVVNHQFSLIKREGKWKRMESSKRKQAEEAAFQAAINWEHTFDAVPDLIAILDDHYRIVRANKAMAARLGLTPDDCAGLTCYRIIHGTDKPPSFCPHRQMLEDGLEHTKEVREDYLGGDFIVSVSPLCDLKGKVTGCIHVARDITTRKQAEKALQESEEKYRNLVETANEGILVIDAEHRITYVNEKMAEMLGCSREAMIGNSVIDFTDEEGKSVFEMNMNKRRQGISESHEFKFISKNGLPLWTLVNSKSFFDMDGKFTGSMSMVTDITKRKEAETKLRETLDNSENLVKERTAELETAYTSLKEIEEGLAEAQKMAHIGNWVWDIYADEAQWSEELYHIYGRDPRELAPTFNEYLAYAHPDDRDYVADAFKKATNGIPYSIDHRIILANGEERTIHMESEIIFSEENIPFRIKGIVQDITERKKAEHALELSEERYRIITEQTGQLVYDYNIEEDAANWAGNVEELTGFTPEEFRNMNRKFWLSLIHPEDVNTLMHKYEESLRSGDAYRIEYRFRKNNGNYIYFEDNGILLKDRRGKANRVLGAVKDVTKRKKAEISLANIENARKKEIHHRIKNNLQVISSLLDLQAEKFQNRECVEDSEVLKAFRESQDRVMSIALIHEELHKGRGTDTLNFSPYLERLVTNLFQTYRLENANTSLNIELEENIFFDMDIAVPLGIIINELISNSLKYAFRGKDNGEIQIKLCREENAVCASQEQESNKEETSKEETSGTNFVLTVSDNGVGIPESFNSESSGSLGLQLVAILVDQLGGELELKRDNGTGFVIRFRVLEEN